MSGAGGGVGGGAGRGAPRFYFSLRSPYSWLAHHDLHRRYPEWAGRLEWRPFWEPDERSLRLLAEAGGEFLYTPMSKAKHLYTLQDVRRLATARGLAIHWPVDRDPWWEVPHLAYLVARRAGRGPQFVAAAHRARWQEGRDICDPATVAALAEGVGVDGAEAAGAAEDAGIRAEGARALLDLYRDGVFGVPYFVHRYERFWGLDRLADFIGSLTAENEARERAEANGSSLSGVPAPAAVDDGHAGGCG